MAKQLGFYTRLATLALLSTLFFFSHGESYFAPAYAENSQPVKMRALPKQQVEEKNGRRYQSTVLPGRTAWRRARTGGVDAGRRRRHH